MSRWGSIRIVAAAAHVNALLASAIFLTGVVLARDLGPEGRGILANLMVWPSWVAQVAVLGVAAYLSRQTALVPADARVNYRRGLAALALSGAIAVALYCAVLVGWRQVGVGAPNLILALLSAIVIPFGMWTILQSEMERARHAYQTYNLARGAFVLIFLVAVLGLWLLGMGSIASFLAAFIGANILASLATQAAIDRTLAAHDATAPSAPPREAQGGGRLLIVSRPYAYVVALNLAATIMDRGLVSIFFSHETLGLYVVGYAAAQIPDVFGVAASVQLFGRVASFKSLSEVPRDWLAMRLRQMIGLYACVCLVSLLVLPFFVLLLFGERYAGSIPIALVLLPALSLRGIARICEDVLKAAGRPSSCVRIRLGGIVAFCVAGLLAAWAGSLPLLLLAVFGVALIETLLMVRVLASEAGIPLRHVLVPRWSDVADVIHRVRSARRPSH